jgi:hypothetical protein
VLNQVCPYLNEQGFYRGRHVDLWTKVSNIMRRHVTRQNALKRNAK